MNYRSFWKLGLILLQLWILCVNIGFYEWFSSEDVLFGSKGLIGLLLMEFMCKDWIFLSNRVVKVASFMKLGVDFVANIEIVSKDWSLTSIC